MAGRIFWPAIFTLNAQKEVVHMGSFEDRKATGTVFNIQKYSVHDGPGIRTIVFLKGCPLSCKWCSNPESQASHPQVAYNKGRCIGCHRCIKACQHGAISINEDGSLKLDRSKCEVCKTLDCAHACPAQGMIIYGENKTVDQILKEVEKDAIFYARSGGGMTLSGGEPLMHADIALPLLRRNDPKKLQKLDAASLKMDTDIQQNITMKRFSRKHKISGCCHMIMHFRSTQLPQKRLHTGRNTQLRFVQHQYIALTAKQAFHIAASLSAQQAQPDARNSHCYRAAAPEQISQHRPSRIRSLTVGSIHSLLMVSESPRRASASQSGYFAPSIVTPRRTASMGSREK